MKKVLIIGSGAREHAIAHTFHRTDPGIILYAAPGNPGMEAMGVTCLPDPSYAIQSLVRQAKVLQPDLTVVGPELPLCFGIVNSFQAEGLTVFGPTRQAAQLEGSKSFCKKFLNDAGVLTPRYQICKSMPEVTEAIDDGLLVVKADGLAAGKGVVVAHNSTEAKAAASNFMEDGILGEEGRTIVMEEKIVGRECSYIVVTDGTQFIPLPTAQDYKRLGNHDKGPMTGGMGSFSPAMILPPNYENVLETLVVLPVLQQLKERVIHFQGALYFGLMITSQGTHVLEINVRFGDPETQSQLIRLESSLFEFLHAAAQGNLLRLRELPMWSWQPAVSVVMASGDYPHQTKTAQIITGIDDAENSGCSVFHGGTTQRPDGLAASGGRVLTVTAKENTFELAAEAAYRGVGKIHFKGQQFRTDICNNPVLL